MKRLEDLLIEAKLGGNYSNTDKITSKPLIKMGNMGRGNISLEYIEYVPDEEDVSLVDRLQEGDLLLNTRNTLELVGKVCVWRSELPIAYYNSNILKMRFDESQVSSSYFMNYLFNSRSVIKELRSFATGTTSVAAIYARDLKFLSFLLPPLPEQRRIAAVLGTWDRAIEQTTGLLKQLRARHRGLMQRLLTGKVRLPGFDREWQAVNANDVFRNISIRNHPNEPLLSATQERGVILRSMLEGRVTMPEGETGGYKLVVPGDFIISLRSFQGGIETSDYRGIVSPAYTVLKPRVVIDDNFYRHYFKSIRFIRQLGVAVIGIRDDKQISFEDFSAIRIPQPELAEQRAIARVLDASLREIRQQEAKLDALREQKRGLMQCLLTGQVRVPGGVLVP